MCRAVLKSLGEFCECLGEKKKYTRPGEEPAETTDRTISGAHTEPGESVPPQAREKRPRGTQGSRGRPRNGPTSAVRVS